MERHLRRRFGTWLSGATMVLLVLASGAGSARATGSTDWPEYLHDMAGSGFNANETSVTASSASNLRLKAGWPLYAGSAISAQPVVANNLVYWGSWDGLEHATPLSGGSDVWSTNLGQTDGTSTCNRRVMGVVSTAAIAPVVLRGQTSPTSMLYVGGGGNTNGSTSARVFGLNALTGAIVWQTALGASPDNVIWSSPSVYTYTTSAGATKTSVYIGVASLGDCPLVQGKLLQLNAATGAIQHSFPVVPDGCVGGGVWSSPVIDASDGSVYFSTGNGKSCSATSSENACTSSAAEPCAVALVKLRASNLAYLDSWQVPTSNQVGDSDFGATPTLFTAAAKSGSSLLVGLANKNGNYYAFNRNNLAAGPVWHTRLAIGGACPQCGEGSIAPSAFDGQRLYVAGGNTTLSSGTCSGSLQALKPSNGKAIWQHCIASGPVLGAVAAAPGIAIVGAGNVTTVVETAHGSTIFQGYSNGGKFFGPASIANGVIYEGDMAGYLYAYSVNGT